ncbi:MAG: FkbM family methyltransferase [Solirubrobacteraceae bacterium]
MSRPEKRAVAAIRRAAAHPRLLPLTALMLRARTVSPTVAFAAREMLGHRGLFVYELRRSGLRVALRHRSGDVVTLGEVFHDLQYEPLRELEPALREVTSIVDLGANVGLFGAFAAARWPQARILAFEPDPGNAAVHERTIAANALEHRWELARTAAGAHDGAARFAGGRVALSHLLDRSEQVAGSFEVPVEDVVPRLAGVDLVKIDIEGGEWAILEDPRFRACPPRTLVLEYHPRFCESREPRTRAERALRAAGLQVRSIWHRADGHGMLWAWGS